MNSLVEKSQECLDVGIESLGSDKELGVRKISFRQNIFYLNRTEEVLFAQQLRICIVAGLFLNSEGFCI